jgi:hypothetical protein
MQLVPPNGVGYFSVALNFTQPQGEDVWASDGGPDPSILEETLAVTYPDVVSGAAVTLGGVIVSALAHSLCFSASQA